MEGIEKVERFVTTDEKEFESMEEAIYNQKSLIETNQAYRINKILDFNNIYSVYRILNKKEEIIKILLESDDEVIKKLKKK